ncbi:hypothetical protein DSO57_1001963 [Entomophthora muscae]|uniref:Uncharacterized protein n=1 Tax=Entomophthora muscae TaxID=34485 RepID=A0ACC2UUP5_9FUNG|nr:hypothetical protein DSO57_1001963 [Entomophthora muscae]
MPPPTKTQEPEKGLPEALPLAQKTKLERQYRGEIKSKITTNLLHTPYTRRTDRRLLFHYTLEISSI